MTLFAHHSASIENVRQHFAAQPGVEAVLLGGSIAHGYARATSDVDILILLPEAEFERRRQQQDLSFFNAELCTYEGGYVDGKFTALSFLTRVAEMGSEPARYAFQDAKILLSRVPDLPALLAAITRYPQEHKLDRMTRFLAQLEAWHWYSHQALAIDNRYLLNMATSKLALFGTRLLLAHNELLYPYHKWMLRVLAQAPEQPADMVTLTHDLMAHPSETSVSAYFQAVRGFREWPTSTKFWSMQFIQDSEWNWMDGSTPIDDL